MKRYFIPIFLLFLANATFAQDWEWKAGMYHFFDNTEFAGSSYTKDQTMAGVRLAPEVGLGWGSHHLYAGFDALHSYGTGTFVDGLEPTAYYEFNDGRLNFCMGSFSRANRMNEFNRAFFSDSIHYYRPNLNGILLSYQKNDFSAKAFLDWTGKEDSLVHEAFFVGGSVAWRRSLFLAEAQVLMFHYAGSILERGVRDNLLMKPALGVDLTEFTWLDTLTLKVGALAGVERNRSNTDYFALNGGLLVELDASWKGIGLQATAYKGKGLMMDYAAMGSKLYWGDPFYRGNSYARVDVTWDFFRLPNLTARLNLANHFSEGNYYVEQLLTVRLALDSNHHNPFHGKK